jgi:hypothetical protein
LKTYEDVLDRLRSELNHWYTKQISDLYADFYLYYLPSTNEHDSGLIICQNQPANPEYRLVCAERIKKELTVSQNFEYFQRFLKSIPILD